ncbi:alpha/beta fold hydrolase [Rhizobium pusense]|uniref:alpha/beta hydrolase n=1 Tax=Agrobacterium pusense TaxID=648995 RepID=UPI000D1AE110|nr:alpha/beta fold hydrolase [Agrobacterium pusense]MDH0912841.1 alpha/beta fold hydrolase [Agrobacterium pusense]MDH1099094.1 alpha/beta fold hydrolase [Agrobacterium pusense]MDH1115663.1 alpha/beta fold hydrolase [Agrobacterium pusense]MDH2197438.1 alpha/beta fold hydrolase [Agrobacterium pusense]
MKPEALPAAPLNVNAPIRGRQSGAGSLTSLLLLFGVFVTALTGCAGRPGPETLDPVAALSKGGKEVTILAVTDRYSDKKPLAFGGDRGNVTYEQFTLQAKMPVTDKKSSASALSRDGNPSKDFVTIARHELDRKAFEARVASSSVSSRDPIMVFVHGYNYSYQEAVFRVAQLGADAGSAAEPILFSWPSQAAIAGYVADKDSSAYARDDLVELLTSLSRSRSKRPIAVLGHSMGGWLVMEALRQLRLEGRDDVIARLQVGLAAPDIDMDVFRKQAAVIGKLSPPLTVLVSSDDRALAVSSRLTGGRPRLGAARIDDPALQSIARQGNMRIFDISAMPATDELNHDRFIAFAARYSSQARRGELTNGFRQAGVYLFDTTGRILSSPFTGTARLIAGPQSF